jgi:hypothetical protein
LFQGSGNVVQQSTNLFWDATNNRLGIGTSSPSTSLDILATGVVTTKLKTSTNTGVASHVVYNDIDTPFEFGMWGSTRTAFGAISPNNAYTYGGVDFALTSTGNLKFGTGPSVAERMRIVSSTGNVLIGTGTDAGFKLDVNGTARVQNQLTTTGSITASGLIARGTYLNQTLVASANNDVLVGLDIAPTFTTGAFTGVSRFGLRINTGTSIYTFADGVIQTNGAFGLNINNLPVLYADNGQTQLCGRGNSSQINMAQGSLFSARFFGTTGNFMVQNSGTYTEIASSRFTVNSTTQGVLFPRMTTTEKNAIASPATGLVLFDTTLNKLCVRGASAWETITSL